MERLGQFRLTASEVREELSFTDSLLLSFEVGIVVRIRLLCALSFHFADVKEVCCLPVNRSVRRPGTGWHSAIAVPESGIVPKRHPAPGQFLRKRSSCEARVMASNMACLFKPRCEKLGVFSKTNCNTDTIKLVRIKTEWN